MEPVGLALRVAGLAGIFSTCMECFDYVQRARSFGKDCGVCVLRLDIAKLRMSRWGQAVGLASGSVRNSSIAMSDQERAIAQSLLEEIMRTFEDAENMSSRYKKRVTLLQPKNLDLAVSNPANDLTADYNALHRNMRQLASKRQKQTSLLRKTQWALYEKRAFDTMVDTITTLTNDLVDLFPATNETQLMSCREDARALSDTPNGLQIMSTVAEDHDAMLQSALQQELALSAHRVDDVVVEGGTFRVGDNNHRGRQPNAIISNGAKIFGTADVWFGHNNYGQPSTSDASSSGK